MKNNNWSLLHFEKAQQELGACLSKWTTRRIEVRLIVRGDDSRIVYWAHKHLFSKSLLSKVKMGRNSLTNLPVRRRSNVISFKRWVLICWDESPHRMQTQWIDTIKMTEKKNRNYRIRAEEECKTKTCLFIFELLLQYSFIIKHLL